MNAQTSFPSDIHATDRRRFIDDWQAHVLPKLQERQFWDDKAISFATSATNLLGVVNGGALVAIPSFAAFSGTADSQTLLGPATVFIIGLVCTLGANMSGFFACARRSESMAHWADHTTRVILELISLREAGALISSPAQISPLQSSATEQKYDHFLRFRSQGILFMFLALSAFIFGVIWSILSLT